MYKYLMLDIIFLTNMLLFLTNLFIFVTN